MCISIEPQPHMQLPAGHSRLGVYWASQICTSPTPCVADSIPSQDLPSCSTTPIPNEKAIFSGVRVQILGLVVFFPILYPNNQEALPLCP